MKSMQKFSFVAAGVLALFGGASCFAQAVDVAKQTGIIKNVGPKGVGHEQAVEAVKILSTAHGDQIPAMLASLDSANILTANWIRAAVESVAANNSKDVPWKEVESFLAEPDHSSFSRRLAYELLVLYQPAAANRLLPQMVNDTCLENRRDAVDWLVKKAEGFDRENQKDEAVAAYKHALDHCRSVQQVKTIIKALGGYGQEIDVTEFLGFVVDWNLIGPFDNTDKAGFDVAYPPEAGIELSNSYAGKLGKVSWLQASSEEPFGVVDLTKILDKHKGAITYAYNEFVSDADQPAQIRLGCINANKIWLNGELVHSNVIYHAGTRVDQYVVNVKLKKGANEILLKVCQNEQKEPWAQRWQFQLRITDPTGKPIYSQQRKKDNT